MAVSDPVRLVDADGDLISAANPLPTSLAASAEVIGTTKDGGPGWTSSYTYTVSADATGKADVTAAPTAGQKIVIDDLFFSVDTAMNLIFEEETSATPIFKVFLPANGLGQYTPRGKIKLPTADKKLRVDASVAGNIAVTCVYHSEA